MQFQKHRLHQKKKRKVSTQTKGNKALSFFVGPTEYKELDGTTKYVYSCNNCFKEINGTNLTNLAAHLQRKHSDIYEENIGETAESIEIKRLKLLQNCVSIVALGGRPFSALLDYGFQQIIKKDLAEFESAGIPLNLKQKIQPEVHRHLHKTANELKDAIKDAVNGRAISVQLDIATRKGRSFFGIDIQYDSDDELKFNNIGIIELDKAHTSEYLLQIYRECLQRYNIVRPQVISITADSGKNLRKLIRIEQGDSTKNHTNMAKVVKKIDFNGISASEDNELPGNTQEQEIVTDNEIEVILASEELMDDDAIDLIFEECEVNPNEAIIDGCNVNPNDLDFEECYENPIVPLEHDMLLKETVQKITQECDHFVLNLTDMTCFAHNLQLTINDALEAMPKKTRNILELYRRVAKVLRLNSTKMLVQKGGLQMNIPCLDVATRWGSLYHMVRSFTFQCVYISLS